MNDFGPAFKEYVAEVLADLSTHILEVIDSAPLLRLHPITV